MNSAFYSRPMVIRLLQIFENPAPPKVIREVQFDGAQEDLIMTAQKAWHEIDHEDYWHYLMDLKNVELQRELFDYLFPAFLIRWWEGLLNGKGGPASETDFYAAIEGGEVLVRMIHGSRRQNVYRWMTDAYLDAVDSFESDSPEGHSLDLHNMLGAFNAIGQSVPIANSILLRLSDVTTIGRAKFWIVLASGLLWENGLCPDVPDCDPNDRYSGIQINYTPAAIYDKGYLDGNLRDLTDSLTSSHLLDKLAESMCILKSTPFDNWSKAVYQRAQSEPEHVAKRLDHVFSVFAKPMLGGWDASV